MPRLSKTRTRSARRTSAPRRCPSRCARPRCAIYPAYADASIRSLAAPCPAAASAKRAIATESVDPAQALAARRSVARCTADDSAPRLYVESLNEMIDMQTTRVAAINNRVPTAISLVVVLGAAVALALMAVYLAMFSRGRRHRPARRRPADAAALRHVRPRPAGPRVHHRSRRAARRGARRHGAAACGRHAPVANL